MVNGDGLAYPLTISSDRPLYVKGDYNTAVVWQPASLIGDADHLSFERMGRPCDGTPTTWGSYKPTASETWVYAAVAAGHSPSVLNGAYGGGLKNFPRFLKNWASATPEHALRRITRLGSGTRPTRISRIGELARVLRRTEA